MSHQTKRPFDSVECSTPHDLLIRCSLSNLQFPAIALTWCGLTSHRHRSIEPFFMSLAARDSEFRRWSGRVDRRICQTFAASPAEPGELPLGFRSVRTQPKVTLPLPAQVLEIDRCFIQGRKQPAHHRQECRGRRSKLHASPDAVEEFDLILPFDQSDLGCDAGLANVEPLRGAGETAFDGNPEKRACLRRCHKVFLCFYRFFCICLIPYFLRLYTRMARQVAGAACKMK